MNAASVHWFFRPYVAGPSNPKPEVARHLGISELLESEVDRSGVPSVVSQGYTGIGDSGALGHANLGNWQVKDNLSLSKGSHTLGGGSNSDSTTTSM